MKHVIVGIAAAVGAFGVICTAWSGEVHEVITQKYQFVPAEITIKVGDTVRWVNKERRAYHNVWFRDLGEKPVGEFFPGETYEKTFDTPGDYPYVCQPHEKSHDMKGIVHVVE